MSGWVDKIMRYLLTATLKYGSRVAAEEIVSIRWSFFLLSTSRTINEPRHLMKSTSGWAVSVMICWGEK